jgi:hypothetical protein
LVRISEPPPDNEAAVGVAGKATAAQLPWVVHEICWTPPTWEGRDTCRQLAPPSVVSAMPAPLRKHSVADVQLTDVQLPAGDPSGWEEGAGTNDQVAPPSIEWRITPEGWDVLNTEGPAQQLWLSGHEMLVAAPVTPVTWLSCHDWPPSVVLQPSTTPSMFERMARLATTTQSDAEGQAIAALTPLLCWTSNPASELRSGRIVELQCTPPSDVWRNTSSCGITGEETSSSTWATTLQTCGALQETASTVPGQYVVSAGRFP